MKKNKSKRFEAHKLRLGSPKITSENFAALEKPTTTTTTATTTTTTTTPNFRIVHQKLSKQPVLEDLGCVACPVDVPIPDDFEQRSGVVEPNSGVAKLGKLAVEWFLVLEKVSPQFKHLKTRQLIFSDLETWLKPRPA